jgi:hypothetical protein
MTTSKSKKPKVKEVEMSEQGYLNHKPGSRKAAIHQLFDQEGPEVAWMRGLKMGLQPGSLRTWFSHWAKSEGKHHKKPGKVPALVETKPEAETTVAA